MMIIKLITSARTGRRMNRSVNFMKAYSCKGSQSQQFRIKKMPDFFAFNVLNLCFRILTPNSDSASSVLGRWRKLEFGRKGIINRYRLPVAQLKDPRADNHVALLEPGGYRYKIALPHAQAHKLLANHFAACSSAVIRGIFHNKNRIAVRRV